MRLYNIWIGMKYRRNSPKCKAYKNYGGRGIRYDDRWEDFNEFCLDMQESYEYHVKLYGEKDTTLDRIDVNGDYTKDNCRWATKREQVINTRRTVFVEGIPLSEWCKQHNLNYNTIRNRLHYWDMSKALNTPIKGITRHNYNFNGLNLKELCSVLNIDYRVVVSRIHRGWDIDKAINTNITKINRIHGKSVRQLCIENGICPDIVYDRLKKGMSVEDALHIPFKPKKQYNIDSLSLRKYCELHGLNYDTTKNRLRRGWTLERALHTPVKGSNKEDDINS